MSKKKLFGPGHITLLILVAVAIGLMGSGTKCGDKTQQPQCTTPVDGNRECSLKTGVQER